MNKLSDGARPIAVLIDAENIVLKHEIMKGLLAKLAEFGTVGLMRLYGNQDAVDKWEAVAQEFGIQPMLQFKPVTKKNATDFALTIDAMDLLHSQCFGGFCLVTGDADFVTLARRIRAEGLSVYNYGAEKQIATSRNAYTKFVSVGKLLKSVVQPKEKVAAKKAMAAPKKVAKPAAPQSATKPTQEVLDSFCEVVASAGGRNQKITLVSLGQRLREDFPLFKAKKYGHAGLGKFLLAHSDLFVCDQKDNKGVTHVRLRQSSP